MMRRTYVALLYSIVLTSQKRVVMSDLRSMAEGLGLRNVRTHVSSGNLVFEADVRGVGALECRLEAAFRTTFGRAVDIVVRTDDAWRRLVDSNPFPEESRSAPDQVAVRVMREPVQDEALDQLRQAAGPGERFAIVAGDPWIVFSRDRPSSRLMAAANHKRLGVGTSRNWNTVRHLAQMVERA